MGYSSVGDSVKQNPSRLTSVSFSKPYSINSSTTLSGSNISVVSTTSETTHTIPVIGIGGFNGKSAYELAVDAGFDGSLADWLQSLTAGSSTNMIVAGEDLNGETVVTLDSQNQARVFDVTNSVYVNAPVFVTTHAGAEGSVVSSIASGYLNYPPGGLTPGMDLYIGLGGRISLFLPPSAAFGRVIGQAINESTIWICPGPGIVLQN